VSRRTPRSMSRRLVTVTWREAKPRLFPSLLCLVYALVIRLNVDHWRVQDQFFVERDPALSFPAVPSTVSNTMLVFTGCVLPFLVLFGLSVWAHFQLPSVSRDAALVWFTAHCFALGNTLLVTVGTYNAGKCVTGRLRPNFFAQCDYKGYGAAVGDGSGSQGNSTLLDLYLSVTTPGAVGNRGDCRATRGETDEASLSFPSGHAAIAFAGAARVVASLWGVGWLVGSLANDVTDEHEDAGSIPNVVEHDWRQKCARARRVTRDVVPYTDWYLHAVSIVPLAYACFVSMSRITDYKHAPADVVAGALVGFFSAVVCDGKVSAGWFFARQAKRGATTHQGMGSVIDFSQIREETLS